MKIQNYKRKRSQHDPFVLREYRFLVTLLFIKRNGFRIHAGLCWYNKINQKLFIVKFGEIHKFESKDAIQE